MCTAGAVSAGNDLIEKHGSVSRSWKDMVLGRSVPGDIIVQNGATSMVGQCVIQLAHLRGCANCQPCEREVASLSPVLKSPNLMLCSFLLFFLFLITIFSRVSCMDSLQGKSAHPSYFIELSVSMHRNKYEVSLAYLHLTGMFRDLWSQYFRKQVIVFLLTFLRISETCSGRFNGLLEHNLIQSYYLSLLHITYSLISVILCGQARCWWRKNKTLCHGRWACAYWRRFGQHGQEGA